MKARLGPDLSKALIVFAVLLFSAFAQAKELTNRLGIGVKNDTVVSIPALAAVYYPSPDYGVTGGLGIDTQKNASTFTANVGIRKIVFREQNMNFFFGGKVGLLNYETTLNGKQNGFLLDAVFGGEFFFSGLENLAFTFEGGAGIASTGDVRFRTIGNAPMNAGIIFYF